MARGRTRERMTSRAVSAHHVVFSASTASVVRLRHLVGRPRYDTIRYKRV